MQRLLLVNEYDVRQIFDLRPDEAQALFYTGTIKFCLADTLRLPQKSGIENGLAFHVAVDDPGSWAAGVNATIDVRRGNGETDTPDYVESSQQANENEKAEKDALAGAFSIVAPPDSRHGGSNLN